MRFAHELEKEFSNLLNKFKVAHLYEPKTFGITYDEQGNIRRGFTPDFYIPELDLYIEITSMNGSSCGKKRKKIEQVWKLYGVKVVLFQKADVTALVKKSKNGLRRKNLCAILDTDEKLT